MTKTNGRRFQLLGFRRQARPARPRWHWKQPTRRRQHDPMLVLNMSEFNYAGGWSGLLGKLHQNGA